MVEVPPDPVTTGSDGVPPTSVAPGTGPVPARGARGVPFVELDPPDAARDDAWMRVALEAAARAARMGDVPVGAVAVRDGVSIAVAWNEKEARHDPTAHAEVLAIRAAAGVLGRWRLPDVTLYVTLEPCAMCAGAMVQARVGRLAFAALDPRAGAAGSAFSLLDAPAHNHVVPVTAGIRADEASAQIATFVQALRARGRDLSST